MDVQDDKTVAESTFWFSCLVSRPLVDHRTKDEKLDEFHRTIVSLFGALLRERDDLLDRVETLERQVNDQ